MKTGLPLRALKAAMAVAMISFALAPACSSENATCSAPAILQMSIVVMIFVSAHSATFTTEGMMHW